MASPYFWGDNTVYSVWLHIWHLILQCHGLFQPSRTSTSGGLAYMTRLSNLLSLAPRTSSELFIASSTSHTTDLWMLIAWFEDWRAAERRLVENCHLTGALRGIIGSLELLWEEI